MIFGQSKQNRVVENASLSVGDQHIFTLTNGTLAQISRRQHLYETRRVWPSDLHLTLDGHVTQNRLVYEVPEILFGVAEISRDVHMVVHGKIFGAPPNRGVKEG